MRELLPMLAALLVATSVTPAHAKPALKGSSPPPYVEHKVLRGETLWRIAQKHRTSVGAIMNYNRMPDQMVREGSVLRIPRPQAPAPRPRQPIHVVRDGESFWSIADRYRVTPKALAEANPNVNPNRIHEDMELVLPAGARMDQPPSPSPSPGVLRPPSPPPAPPKGIIEHMVQPNETYYSIAKRYGVKMESVVAANPKVRPERLRPGLVVAVPTKGAAPKPTPPSPAPAPSPSPNRPVLTARTYKIKEGDTMSSIAQKHGVSVEALLKENNLSKNEPFYVDDVLRIPGATANSGKSSTARPASARPSTSPPSRKTASTTNSRSTQLTKSHVPREKDGSVRSYTVLRGETVTSISSDFRVSPKALLAHNHLTEGARLREGDEISIPSPARRS